MAPDLSRAADLDRARCCLDGDEAAIAMLQADLEPVIEADLDRMGANREEIEEILTDLWPRAIVGDAKHPSLLDQFDGRGSLHTFLKTVCVNRWVSLKRRQNAHARWIEIQELNGSANGAGSPKPQFEAEDAPSDNVLTDLLGQALNEAFRQCSPRSTVILRLLHCHELTQREVAGLLQCNETKISRLRSSAEGEISALVTEAIRKRDPWLHIEWEDFLHLCQNVPTIFPEGE